MSDTLNPERVHAVLLDCLFREHELVGGRPAEPYIPVIGITTNFGLHAGRVESHKTDIKALVDELPSEFAEGWSFLQMCMNRHGRQWTGSHKTMEELAALGQAAGFLNMITPRFMWPALPGMMPYYRTGVFETTVETPPCE